MALFGKNSSGLGWGPKTLKLRNAPWIFICVKAAAALYLIIAVVSKSLIYVIATFCPPDVRIKLLAFYTLPGVVLTLALAYPTFIILRPPVRLLIAVSWRAIEYPTGAWAAIVFLSRA